MAKKITQKQLEEPNITGAVRLQRDPTYPSESLTPGKLADALKEADRGNVAKQAELFGEMEGKDWDLGSALSTRRNAVSGLDYSIVPGDDSALGKKAAEATAEMLNEYLANFRTGMGLLLSSIGQGFSVAEINWEQRDGMIWPVELVPVEPRFFTFRYDDRLQREPRMLTEKEPENGEDLILMKYILHRYTGHSGLSPKDGLVRQCAYIYLFKNYGIKDWVSFMDRYGIPMRIGKYGAGASNSAVDVLRRAVLGLGADAAALISEATAIELVQSDAAPTEMFERLADYFGKKIDKVVLGHTGVAEATPGRLGNDKEAQLVRQDIKAKDALELAQTINHQLIWPFALLNFGESCPMPRIKFAVEPPEDKKNAAEVIQVLSSAGLTSIPVQWLHDKFSIPLPQKGEQTLADLRPQPMAYPLADKRLVPLRDGEESVGMLKDMLPADDVYAAMDAEIRRLVNIILTCSSLGEAQARIAAEFPAWNETELTEHLTQALFLVETAGLAEDLT